MMMIFINRRKDYSIFRIVSFSQCWKGSRFNSSIHSQRTDDV